MHPVYQKAGSRWLYELCNCDWHFSRTWRLCRPGSRQADEKAEAAGKTKVTKSIAKPQFNAGKARKFLEIISSCKETTSGGLIIEVPPAMQAEVLSILQEFRYETSAPGEDEQNNEQASSSEESDAA